MLDPSEYDPELLALAWAQLQQEWNTIARMCQIAVRRGHEHWHEALSEVAVRMPDVLLSWDPSKGRALNSHVIGNCRWFIFKEFVYKKRQRQAREVLLSSAPEQDDTASVELRSCLEAQRQEQAGRDEAEEVQYILDGLDEADQVMIRLYFMEGLTLQEMGEVLGCSKSNADRLLTASLHRAKMRAARMR